MNNNSLIPKKISIVTIIKKAIFYIFQKKEKQIVDDKNYFGDENFEIMDDNFNESLIIKKDLTKESLVELQKDLEMNIISIEDISNEDFVNIINLYENQIKELNENTKSLEQSTKIYKSKINQLLKK